MPTAIPHAQHPAMRWRPAPARARALSAGVLALCTAAVALAQPAAPAPAPATTDVSFATQVLHAVNLHRQRHQLPALQPAPWLATLAAEHSAHMAQLGRLSHTGFQTRFLRARRQTCVENLAAGFRQADRLVQGWQASPSHHQNLLDPRVQDVGVASINGHVTWLACSAD